MRDIYAPIMRALVVAALVLATATLMFVTINTARATIGTASGSAGQAMPTIAPAPGGRETPALRELNS